MHPIQHVALSPKAHKFFVMTRNINAYYMPKISISKYPVTRRDITEIQQRAKDKHGAFEPLVVVVYNQQPTVEMVWKMCMGRSLLDSSLLYNFDNRKRLRNNLFLTIWTYGPYTGLRYVS